MSRRFALAALLLLAGLGLVFFARLAFTDDILARGDTFAYFYPYWHTRDSALLAGRLPLWSPDIFMGVPLLSNIQLGTFYPPNWLTLGLIPPDAIRISILLHIVWSLAGAFLLARRSLGVGALPALVAAAVYGFGGHVGAHVEQINQLQGLAWLPWIFLLLHSAIDRPFRYTPLLALALAFQFLAGHTQTVFITGVGLVIYGVVGRRWRFLPLLILAGGWSLALALPQLIPTFELANSSNRRGGFNQNQATAFSFSPFVAGRGLLPSFDGLIFAEYIAYTGVFGLGLALIGLFTRSEPAANERPFPRRTVWAAVALIGLALALGLYNPIAWMLAGLPGFNLFRVPARWLALFALGTAMLAGLGLQALIQAPARVRVWTFGVITAAVIVLGLGSTLAPRTLEIPISAPETVTMVGWAVALIALLVLVAVSRVFGGRARYLIPALIAALAVGELWLAAQVLPYNDPSPSEAYTAGRFTVSQLRALEQDQTPPGRLLSISRMYFDPGDRPALETRYAAMGESVWSVGNLFQAIKMKETLAPNLSLLYHIPSIDGFDGGLLPSGYYTAFTSLLLPPDALRTLDGRLGEWMALPECRGACLPEDRWLTLTDTRYLITDKIYDLWHEDVNYDLQFTHGLEPGDSFSPPLLPDFTADSIWLLYRCPDGGTTCRPPVVSARDVDGVTVLPLIDSGAAVEQFARARYALPDARLLTSLRAAAAEPLTLGAVTLVDARTGDFMPVTLGPWTRILSSDIKLYEHEAGFGRAVVLHDVRTVADHEWGTEDALNLMRDPAFDPAETIVLSVPDPNGLIPLAPGPQGEDSAQITAYSAEHISVEVTSSAEGYLMLTDAFYPGWRALVNGRPTDILRADVMFRAVRVPAGASTVVFEYRPGWLPQVLYAGAAAWLLTLGVVLAGLIVRRGERL